MNFTMDATTITLIILVLIVFVLIYMIFELNKKLQKFLVGSSSGNLDESMTAITASLKELETFKSGMETYLTSVEGRLQKSVQAVYTVRFNPFKGTGSGGNQSFATAFLNQEGTGAVISTLYAREHISIFSKPIVKGVSEYELSTEEKEAVDGAMKIVK